MVILSKDFKLNTFLVEQTSKNEEYGLANEAIFTPKTKETQLLSNKEIKNILKVMSCELFSQRLVENFSTF